MKLISFNLQVCEQNFLFKKIDEYVMEKEIGLLGDESRFIVKLINSFLIEVRNFLYQFFFLIYLKFKSQETKI